MWGQKSSTYELGPGEMSSVYKKKSSVLYSARVNLWCSTCRKPKLPDIYNPKPITNNLTEIKNEHCISRRLSSTRRPWDKQDSVMTCRTTTSSTIAVSQFAQAEACMEATMTIRAGGRIRGKVPSVAVEKESDNPYMDFLHSMLEMILENEIYSRDGLVQLLSCFLQLNSPYHHGSIVQAFTEISTVVFNPSTSPS